MSHIPTPLSSRERIDYMDLLRGIAIFGILIANLRWFSLYSPQVSGMFTYEEIDHVIYLLQGVFIESKFYTIFSLLFGWGIALQINRSQKDDASTAGFLRRRLCFMMLLGGMHMFFIWEGDIVFLYGLVGFVLVALRKYSNSTLLITGILMLLSPVLLYFLKMNWPWVNYPSDYLYSLGEKMYQHFGWIDQDTSRTGVLSESKSIVTSIKITLADAPYRFAYLFAVSRIPKVLGAMLIGFYMGRTNLYSKIMKHKNVVLKATIAGLIVFVPLNYWLEGILKNEQAYYQHQIEGLYYTIADSLTVFPLALVYMTALALLFEKKWIQIILNPVLAVGKTAFSNYVFQSLIGIIIFYGVGFGLAGQFGPLAWTIAAVIIFSFQIILSNLWLKYFRFGPLEWIWRSLTYRKIQPLKLAKD
ncbi:DUF418 domain-containing protein [uncultured Draconibacterium sp.]|uniref:DUF418 domain-containing protein n=1 Tax=uncultured Draconibacterium sp. TaxID=1573823 RepID=UPI0029C8777D|nr:DUF418 domain-containing protein [uncultured Draconibacterium sp.]